MQTRVTLASLLSGIDVVYTGDADTVVTGLAYDSRQVQAGDVFVAVPGFVHDGLGFVADAVAAGAVAIVAQADLADIALPAPPALWGKVANARRILAPMAAAVIRMAISRQREYGVDETGVHITHAPLSLASALQKLEDYSRVRPMQVNPAAFAAATPVGESSSATAAAGSTPRREHATR